MQSLHYDAVILSLSCLQVQKRREQAMRVSLCITPSLTTGLMCWFSVHLQGNDVPCILLVRQKPWPNTPPNLSMACQAGQAVMFQTDTQILVLSAFHKLDFKHLQRCNKEPPRATEQPAASRKNVADTAGGAFSI